MLSLSTGGLDIALTDFFGKAHIWLFFLGVLLLTSIGAGIYPALYVSSFSPVHILRGPLKIGGKERFSRTLLAVQFAISFLAITLVITLWQNDRYQHNRDWGYDQEQVLGVPLDASDQYPILRDRVLQDPNILSLTGSAQHFGQSSRSSIIEVDARQHQVTRFDVGLNYLETMGVPLKAGRFFDVALSTDLDEAVIVNETLVEAMGWDAPVGQVIRFGERDYTVVGVVRDFHYWNFFSEIQPVIVRAVPETEFQYLITRTRPGLAVQTHNRLAQTWRDLFPGRPFFGFFQDAVFERAFRDNRTVMTVTGTAAVIALLLSCMGLFGLVTLMIAKRMRVLSIHKVLGATPIQVANLINRQFAVLLAAALIVGTPLSYFVLQAMLDSVYEYHAPVESTAFVLSALAIFLIAALTIATRIYKAATANPVDVLRTS